MPAKSPLLSRTIWFGALTAILSGLAGLVPALAPVSAWLSANAALVGVIWGVLAVGLRLVTKGAVELGE